MNQSEVNNAIAEKTGLSAAKVKDVLEAQAELAKTAISGNDEFPVYGVGKIKGKMSEARTGRNPSNGEPIQIPASKRVTLTVGKAFKEAVQK